jgi:hypothetical protein
MRCIFQVAVNAGVSIQSTRLGAAAMPQALLWHNASPACLNYLKTFKKPNKKWEQKPPLFF